MTFDGGHWLPGGQLPAGAHWDGGRLVDEDGVPVFTGGYAGVQLDGIVAPEGSLYTPPAGLCSHLAAFMRAVRIVVPRSGILCDLHELVSNIGTGVNLRGAIYDTGEALNGSYTRLWLGNPVAAVVTWTKLGDPELEVQAGQELLLAVGFDATQGNGVGAPLSSALSALPAGFARRGLTLRRALLGPAAAGVPPAAVTNAVFGVDSSFPVLIARVR